MQFEWDEVKNQINVEKHGIHFMDAKEIFQSSVYEFLSGQWHGESRILAVGLLKDVEITVIYTMRGDRVRIISARVARKNERKKYWENIEECD
ncbi:MAG: BrnT family toxin [Candidatus Latescibacteria bacterium]|jgi:uncharacterized protein|nr:BrnT family toxin [Candidatus Latescibacterota bacterium]MBT5829535.1 BrnT family toxin [Candidatus Latescibacterota bacterium]